MSFKNKSFKTSFIVGFSFCAIAILLMVIGFADLGLGMFFFLPLAIGISSGMLPDLKNAIGGTIVALIFASVLLAFTQIEGVICVLMALPILLLCSWIGWGIGRMIRKKNGDENKLQTSFAPFLIFIMATVFELFIGNPFVPSSVSSTVVIDGSASQVYNSIIHVDTVDVETNLLQKIGLPIPRKCILTEEKIGGLRYCEFEEGQIIETIKEIRKNEYLRMEITECKLGKDRNWLKFHEDIYTLNPIGDNQTEIIRTTTYSSNLKPRIYWEYIEALTISSEQDFVFRNLIKDVAKL